MNLSLAEQRLMRRDETHVKEFCYAITKDYICDAGAGPNEVGCSLPVPAGVQEVHPER